MPALAAPSSGLVISQVYGGAGCGSPNCSTYKNDYIEIFNRGGTGVSVNGWSVQYASATGTAWQVTNLPNVTIPAGGYLLVGEGAGANGVNNIPAPEVTGTIAMSATAAKVALVNATTALSGACPTGAVIVDFVGFGSANCFETAVLPSPTTTTAAVRAGGGCTETDNNSTDFSVTTPNPRNTGTTPQPCGNAISISDVTSAEGNAGTTNFTFTVSLTATTASPATFDITTSNGTATAGVDYVAKTLSSQTIAAGGTYTFTVAVNGDTSFEPNETFFVDLTNVIGAAIAKSRGTGTITNDDVPQADLKVAVSALADPVTAGTNETYTAGAAFGGVLERQHSGPGSRHHRTPHRRNGCLQHDRTYDACHRDERRAGARASRRHAR